MLCRIFGALALRDFRVPTWLQWLAVLYCRLSLTSTVQCSVLSCLKEQIQYTTCADCVGTCGSAIKSHDSIANDSLPSSSSPAAEPEHQQQQQATILQEENKSNPIALMYSTVHYEQNKSGDMIERVINIQYIMLKDGNWKVSSERWEGEAEMASA